MGVAKRYISESEFNLYYLKGKIMDALCTKSATELADLIKKNELEQSK